LILSVLLACALSRTALHAEPTLVPPEEAEILVETLRAGLDQWEREISFKSTFTSRGGRTKCLADPVTGAIEPVHIVARAKGVLIKDGADFRMSIDFERGPQWVQRGTPHVGPRSRTNGELIGNIPVEQLSSASATLLYRPVVNVEGADGWKTGGSAFVQPSTPDQAKSLNAANFGAIVTPLSPSPKAGLPLARLLDAETLMHVPPSEVKRSVYKHGDDLVEVVSEAGSDKLRLFIWTAPFPPVLKALYLNSAGTANLGDYEYRVILLDFRECEHGMVPTRVIATSGHDRVTPWRFKEWISDDLGDTPPTREDFVLHLPGETRIGGLKVLPRIVDGKRSLRMDDVPGERIASLPQSAADIVDPSAPPRQPAHTPDHSRAVLLIAFNSFVAVVLSGYAFLNRRKRRARDR
jgi:hypothetical protein